MATSGVTCKFRSVGSLFVSNARARRQEEYREFAGLAGLAHLYFLASLPVRILVLLVTRSSAGRMRFGSSILGACPGIREGR